MPILLQYKNEKLPPGLVLSTSSSVHHNIPVSYGPQFSCVCCHMHKFLWSVVELSEVQGLKTGEAKARFLDLPYLAAHPALFLQLDRNWCCHKCQKSLDRGIMPALAAKNGLGATWSSVPRQLRDLSQPELEMAGLSRVSNAFLIICG